MARSIEYRILEEADSEDVWNLILEIYRTSESTVAIFNFSEDDLRILLQKSVEESISQRVSVGAFDAKTNKLVGVLLAGLGRLHSFATESDGEFDHDLSRKMRQSKKITHHFVGGDPSYTFGTRHYLHVRLLVSDPAYNNDEIESELWKRCEKIASEEKCEKIVSVVSTARSRTILKKFEYVTEKTVSVRDYVDPISGEKILADIPKTPDVNITLEVKYLRPGSGTFS